MANKGTSSGKDGTLFTKYTPRDQNCSGRL